MPILIFSLSTAHDYNSLCSGNPFRNQESTERIRLKKSGQIRNNNTASHSSGNQANFRAFRNLCEFPYGVRKILENFPKSTGVPVIV